jgi:hypothetical protein
MEAVIGKREKKIRRALERRIKDWESIPNKSGFNKPGSMNKKKTGY